MAPPAETFVEAALRSPAALSEAETVAGIVAAALRRLHTTDPVLYTPQAMRDRVVEEAWNRAGRLREPQYVRDEARQNATSSLLYKAIPPDCDTAALAAQAVRNAVKDVYRGVRDVPVEDIEDAVVAYDPIELLRSDDDVVGIVNWLAQHRDDIEAEIRRLGGNGTVVPQLAVAGLDHLIEQLQDRDATLHLGTARGAFLTVFCVDAAMLAAGMAVDDEKARKPFQTGSPARAGRVLDSAVEAVWTRTEGFGDD